LWLNFMTDGLPALALGMEPAEKDVMKRPPRAPNEHVLSGEWGRLIFAGLWAYAVAFAFYVWELSKGVSVEEARTATLTLAIFIELGMAFTTRSRRPIWEIGFFTNKWLVGAAANPLALHILLVFTKFGKIIHFVPLTLAEWLETAGIALVGFFIFECLKLIPERRRRS
ncbi:MAG: cation-translocating P-type ATPase C-terminal domain-containing protein, partial [Zetaproteobacteria bacterium]|nr:cation-translocating P-type ATPase C-terminal domain-containing protein [Zetaproteobacteria bacterium]